jgi:hypothetical protein
MEVQHVILTILKRVTFTSIRFKRQYINSHTYISLKWQNLEGQ